jgi:ferritin-like metal-binding protein YciE
MTTPEQKIVQYLNEAHATESALVRVLQEQIATAPRGRYRSALEQHLRETREHATRVAARRRELQGGGDVIAAVVGTAQDAVGQMLALAKAPLDIVRGTGGEEKVLKNAKDACATEALEIATYIALEHLADAAGDAQTAQLAAALRADEEAMLAAIQRELPALARAVVRADVDGEGSYDVAATGAGESVREAAQETARTARAAAQEAAGTALGGDEPWAGYDDATAGEITERVRDAAEDLARRVRDYERAHKGRVTVLRAAERELAHA